MAAKRYPENWFEIAKEVKERNNWKCERCKHPHDSLFWYILTVHHIDGDIENNKEWNLAALCQRCHLKVQGINLFVRRDKEGRQLTFGIIENNDWFEPHYEGYFRSKQRKEENIP